MRRGAYMALLAGLVLAGCDVNDKMMGVLVPKSDAPITVDRDERHPPEIERVQPAEVDAGPCTITVLGSALTSYAKPGPPTVWIGRAGARIEGRVRKWSRTTLVCEFDLSAAQPGRWDAHVGRPDGAEATAERALAVRGGV